MRRSRPSRCARPSKRPPPTSRRACRSSPAPRWPTFCCATGPEPAAARTSPDDGDAIDDITAALLDLDSSYVAVHGPPGTGKTYTAAHVITRLVAEYGWRIGVVAQSHAVVENLLRGAINAGIDPLRVAKKKADRHDVAWQQISENEYAAFIGGTPGCVIGGTAWDFANPGRVPPGSLDLLVIDEAGQFCLANTIAVASAAANLLLLGDPQQLPQVSQGTHPEPVDGSALGWLVEDHRTLPAERGYFLDRSRRMHPAVCAPVSALAYEGRLQPFREITAARRLDGYPPGVQVLRVRHEGNSTESPEEAQAIVGLIKTLVGSTWTSEARHPAVGRRATCWCWPPTTRRCCCYGNTWPPRGLGDVRVGTVDKFQGTEAPVAIVSMTASSVEDIPRGIPFLLNRNRLNVAISRAQYAAVVVRAETLTDYLPTAPSGVVDLGAFLALTGSGPPS